MLICNRRTIIHLFTNIYEELSVPTPLDHLSMGDNGGNMVTICPRHEPSTQEICSLVRQSSNHPFLENASLLFLLLLFSLLLFFHSHLTFSFFQISISSSSSFFVLFFSYKAVCPPSHRAVIHVARQGHGMWLNRSSQVMSSSTNKRKTFRQVSGKTA